MWRWFPGFLMAALCCVPTSWAAPATEGCASAAASTTQGGASDGPSTGDTVSVSVERTSLAGVPAILRVPSRVTKPLIILWHGLGPPASEAELMSALPLDDVPAVKVYLGLPLFGARAPAAGDETLAERQAEDYALRIFDPVVVGAARELPQVLAALRARKCPGATGKIGLFGFSAGGAAVLDALVNSSVPVSAAVTINAPAGLKPAIAALERATKRPYTWSAESRQLEERTDPILHAGAIAHSRPPPAILLFHGAEDTTISSIDSATLEHALQPLYAKAGYADRIRFVTAPGIAHSWLDPSSAQEVRHYATEWFNRFL